MPDAGANLWLSQAESDQLGAALLYSSGDCRTYCQTIAKYQQTVEKSLKAMAAMVRDAGIAKLPSIHYYRHDLEGLMAALRHLPRPIDNHDIQRRIDVLLNEHRRAEIKALSDLAPKKPAPGALHPRNNEYPYETAPGTWTAPALPGSFSPHDVERFQQLAECIYQGTRQIVSAIRRR